MSAPEFVAWPKIHRLNRTIIITEKIDGTNAQIYISEDGQTMKAGSRNRWLSLDFDNYGFCAWVVEHQDELMKLGPGRHYGEWWGHGIGRRYNLLEKRFSLFNTERWQDGRDTRPACCGVVPILNEGVFSEVDVNGAIERLRTRGSIVSPGFMDPEGIVIYHHASKSLFKKLCENDAIAKGAQA